MKDRHPLDRAWRRFKAGARVRLAMLRLRASLDGPLVIGFWINRSEVLAAAAVRPTARFVRFGFLSRHHCWSDDEVRELLETVARMTAEDEPTVIVWGIRDRTHGQDLDEWFPVVVRMESGLLPGPPGGRLKTAFMEDRAGIYFDGRRPSDCERALQALLAGYAERSPTARAVLDRVRHARITKYVPGADAAVRLEPGGLLILGQVNRDQAVTETLTVAKTNFDLVVWMRETRPVEGVDRYYYKPHPLNRRDNDDEVARLLELYPDLEIVAPGVNVHRLFEQRPRVATMTSGAGLEAALHGCEVFTFGISFYSNFGFTVDHFDCPRRTNRLSAEDVAACMWLDRTVYVDPGTRLTVPAGENPALFEPACR
ncbi:MAG: hypothetical protein OYH76_07320 [Defluviicoccus sp.]|nr:hypothetical protein [Defluviicoccus sp.]MDE0275689.1 hypothetical protein [Defluviicoccus sp.]